MSPTHQETARRVVCQMVSAAVLSAGADDATAIRLIAAATEWPETAIARRIADVPRPKPHTPTPSPTWEDALETLLLMAGCREHDTLSRSLDSIIAQHQPSDSPPPPKKERIAAKAVRAVRNAFGWSEAKTNYLVNRFATLASEPLARLPELKAQLALGLELGWYAPTARTPRTAFQAKGEGATRQHAHSRTSRTTILPLYFPSHKNDMETKVESQSEPSAPTPTELPPLPLSIVRQVSNLVAAHQAATGQPPTHLHIDPALVNHQPTVLGLAVQPTQSTPTVS